MKKIFLTLIVLAFTTNYMLGQQYNCYTSTPKGTTVYMICHSWEPLSSAAIANNNNYVDTQWPNASRISDASGKYNCHSFAWYYSAFSNTAWMNSPNDDKYWNDGSYSSSNVTSGTHISYVYGDHSGRNLTPDYPGWIYSKWGQLPVMVHRWDYSPYTDSFVRYYR